MKRFSTTIILMTAVLTFTVILADAQTGPVTFSVQETRIDLGDIKAGTDAVATFTFVNEGTEDVKIIKAKPS